MADTVTASTSALNHATAISATSPTSLENHQVPMVSDLLSPPYDSQEPPAEHATPRKILLSTYERMKADKTKTIETNTCKSKKKIPKEKPQREDVKRQFVRFSDLPKEVRFMIWEEAITSRVVYLEDVTQIVERARLIKRRIKDKNGQDICISRSKMPDILLTCQEAYTVMSKHYTRTFSYEHRKNARTYFNYKRDILLVTSNLNYPSDIREEERCMVQHLALLIPLHCITTTRMVCQTLEQFPSLKILTLVYDTFSWPEYRWHDVFTNNVKRTGGLGGTGCSSEKALKERLNLNMKILECRRHKSILAGKPWEMPELQYRMLR